MKDFIPDAELIEIYKKSADTLDQGAASRLECLLAEWKALMAAIGDHPTAELAIRAVKEDRAERDSLKLQIEEMRKLVVTLHLMACCCDLHPGAKCDTCKMMDDYTLKQNQA